MFARIDPMVRLILAATLLATVLPATGLAHAVVQLLANAAVFVLFLLYGLKLARADVRAALLNFRLLLPLALFVFGVMAAGGWGMAQVTQAWLPATVALGFVYLGVMPSTVQSATVYTSLAGGNLAISVIAAALLNLLGVFISAPMFALLAGGESASAPLSVLIKIMGLMLLPFAQGQLMQNRAGGWVKEHKPLVTVLERGTVWLAVYSSMSSAVADGIWRQLSSEGLGVMLAGCLVLLLLGYGGAWLLASALGLDHGDRVAMIFAGAQKSIAVGAPLATVMFPPAIAGTILLPLMVYHLAQIVAAAQVARALRQPV